VLGTNPNKSDTDGDNFNDYAEVYAAHNPLLNTDYRAANLSAFTAIELEFVTQVGTTYQLQTSPDLLTWTNFKNAITDDGTSGRKRIQPAVSHGCIIEWSLCRESLTCHFIPPEWREFFIGSESAGGNQLGPTRASTCREDRPKTEAVVDCCSTP
jgi:hypothetical protein